MMKKKYLLTSVLSLLISSVGFAQNNLGIDYFGAGEMHAAKVVFTNQLTAGQSPAEAYYYLGEIAYATGDVAGAKADYEKGLAASPDYTLNSVGLAKLMLKTDPKGAESAFSEAIKKDKKNEVVLLAVAKAYADNGMQEKAQKAFDEARKANKKSPLVFIYEGDQFMQAKDAGKATGSYAQAINYDPNNVLAHVKSAQVYENADAATAIEDWKTVIKLEPDYLVAYRHLGKIYWNTGKMAESIDAYKIFVEKNHYTMEDLTYYASALYFTKQYDKAKALVTEGLKLDPNNFVLNRLLMYSYVDSNDTVKGLNQADKFFALTRKPEDKYTPQDYTTYGTVLSQTGQFDKAMMQYDNVVNLDSTKYDIYKTSAAQYQTAGQNENAAVLMGKYIKYAAANKTVESLDYYKQGQDYYAAAGPYLADKNAPDKIAKGTDLMTKASASFAEVSNRLKDNYLGYLWQGRSQASLDPESTKGLAKPFYEQTVQIILALKDARTASETSALQEAYRYLAYYHYLQYYSNKSADDKAQVGSYCTKLLQIDPSDTAATQLEGAINPAAAKK